MLPRQRRLLLSRPCGAPPPHLPSAALSPPRVATTRSTTAAAAPSTTCSRRSPHHRRRRHTPLLTTSSRARWLPLLKASRPLIRVLAAHAPTAVAPPPLAAVRRPSSSSSGRWQVTSSRGLYLPSQQLSSPLSAAGDLGHGPPPTPWSATLYIHHAQPSLAPPPPPLPPPRAAAPPPTRHRSLHHTPFLTTSSRARWLPPLPAPQLRRSPQLLLARGGGGQWRCR
ncbi:hypothetical protein PVAP13_7NG100489 [Panicum virgatum]|uniref:Uncharacterized protein n=1 Tax=Panicum virgatum TaxID=38727 RepID=A0A8T0PTP6_PANVG|nr:hypothetical protein PVAP13_7NG100489 [Panicum virgatum]